MAKKNTKDDAKSKLPEINMEKLSPILIFLSIGLAFAVGVLWQKVSFLEGGGTAGTRTQGSTAGTNPQPQQPQGPQQGKLSEEQVAKIPEVTEEDHIRGSADAQVYLIEYSDLECPFCSRFHPTAQQVLDEYGDQVAWVYRHFPLDSIHPRAREAAEASECVAELGGDEAFWAFADAIFENQQGTLSDLPGTAASSAGVSESAVQACIDEERYADKVESQYQTGLEAGVTGTPGNFVVNSNGEAWLIPGAQPFEQVQSTIEEALQS